MAARKPASSRRGVGPHPVHDPQRDAAVEVPLLHGRGDPHAAGEEEDVGIDVGLHRLLEVLPQRRAEDPQQGEEHQRHAGRDVDGDRLGEPPDRHQGGAGRGVGRARAPLRVVLEGRVEPGQEGESEEAGGEADGLPRGESLAQGHGVSARKHAGPASAHRPPRRGGPDRGRPGSSPASSGRGRWPGRRPGSPRRSPSRSAGRAALRR